MKRRNLAALVVLVARFAFGQGEEGAWHRYRFQERIPLLLDPTRIAVFQSPDAEEAEIVLGDFGIHAGNLAPWPIPGWSLVATPIALRHDAGIRSLVAAIAEDGRGLFASPVFTGDDGDPVFVTPDLLVGFGDGGSLDGQRAALADACPGALLEPNFAAMRGAWRARKVSRSGIAVLARANALAESASVRFAEPDFVFTGRPANDPDFSQSWGLHNAGQTGGTTDMDMDGLEAWELTTGSLSAIVVVIDVGVDQAHPDIHQIAGADFTGQNGGGGPVNRCDNHGTAVAGCISAIKDNHVGSCGIAPGCRIASARAMISNPSTCDGQWTSQTSWTVSALAWAQILGARVTNNSNTYGFTSAAIDAKYAAAKAGGIVHFASAGNTANPSLYYPASISSVNAVAALTATGALAAFSNHGPGLAYSAPGDGIFTTDRTGAAGYQASGDYTTLSGTSYASAFAAGVAALAVSANGALTPPQVESVLQESTVDLGVTGYDTMFGWGFVNARAAVVAAIAASTGKADVVGWGGQVFDSRLHDETFVEVAANHHHTVARRSDGSVVAWGDNAGGQCNVPALPSGLDYVEVSAGGRHTVARRSDGSVVAWGLNVSGQCNVPVPPSSLTYVEIAAGEDHTIARRSDGSVVAWGYNGYGQCNVPTLPFGVTYAEVSTSWGHAVARRSDGVAVAWGYNGYGQCNVPVLPSGLTYVEVAAGFAHTVARRSDGSVVAWGQNAHGQCDVPAAPSGLTYVDIAAGEGHTVARRSDGSAVAWGQNGHGQCNVPVLPSGLTYVEIAAGWGHTVARRSDGSVVIWGRNTYGQCNVPAMPSGLTYVEVAAGGEHTIGRRNDGSVVAWGADGEGQCNVPPLPYASTWVDVAAGGRHTVARRSDGPVVAWGQNTFGQCNVPAPLSGLTYVEVSAGGQHTVARRSDNSVVAWGQNAAGQCDVPGPPAGLTCVDVEAGGGHTVIRWSDGSVVAWGYNGYGQCNVVPLPVGLSYVEVSAGGQHSVARRSDNSVVAWGHNAYGQCNVPPLPPGLGYVEIAAGFHHTVARRSDGSVVAWGRNHVGQCDVPSLPSGLTWVEIEAADDHTVARVSSGAGAGMAVSVGAGAGGAGVPVLSCTLPRVGQATALSLGQATPNAAGMLYLSPGGAVLAPIGLGVVIALDLATFVPALPVATSGAGGWGASLTLPLDGSLIGVQVTLQAALFPTAGPFGVDISNGVTVTVGY